MKTMFRRLFKNKIVLLLVVGVGAYLLYTKIPKVKEMVDGLLSKFKGDSDSSGLNSDGSPDTNTILTDSI